MRTIDAATARAWLFDGGEVAFLDVREAGAFGEGHPFLAVPLPYSRLELDVARLVPRLRTRIILIDAGDGVAARAGQRLESLGYSAVHRVEGGVDAWTAAGFRLFQGVNVPSKAFGEAVEHALATPHISVAALAAMQAAGQPVVLLDGRPPEEHRKMAVPGSVCCPNGELALRAAAMAPDPATPIVVHCAGRTRSIVGAQTLIDLGLPNPVFALENGTQGWMLADKALEHGSTRRYPALAADEDLRLPRRHARGSQSHPPPISCAGDGTPSGRRSSSTCVRPRRSRTTRSPAPDTRRAGSCCRRPTSSSAPATPASSSPIATASERR